MDILEKYIPGENLVGRCLRCHETGAVFTGAVDGCSVNYASDAAGWLYCDAGVNAAVLRRIADPSARVIYAYVSGDGSQITGWKGSVLMQVTRARAAALPFGRRRSWVHGTEYTTYHARDAAGGMWWGKSSPYVSITMRRLKHAPRA